MLLITHRINVTAHNGIDSKNEPIEGQLELDEKFKRTSPGTDLYILGFRKEEDWKEKITCLRISDFNTTGLYGEKFYLLTKGSGITDKTGATGGSKGIGKYASFVASSFNTVFYSTYAKDGKKQFLGISKLCSAPMPDTDELTMGIGYYGVNNKNEPIERQLNLDKNLVSIIV